METEQPVRAFAAAREEEYLGDRPAWAYVRAGFRKASEETYDVLWPPGLTDFSVT